ncbi:MAG: hypothetical protein SGPRY_002264, partial [Prymnesium sp.]
LLLPPAIFTLRQYVIVQPRAHAPRARAQSKGPTSPHPLPSLSNSLRLPPPSETTLQCVNYAGPMFFPYNPGGTASTHSLRAAKLPTGLADQPTLHPPRNPPLRPFTLSSVRLHPSSRVARAQATNTAFLSQLEADRLLYFFRDIAKLPQPSPSTKPYGGWESLGSGLRGEFIGHYLSAAAAASAASGDQALRERCEYVVRVLEECQQAHADGYLSAFPQREFAQVES